MKESAVAASLCRRTPNMQLNPIVSEWLNFIARWVHVFAGIMWVGTTYYFTWLDARLSKEEKAMASVGKSAQIWMVHSGGFYVVEKRKVPDELSRKLHWFRWEAATTWLSGFALLLVVYYIGGGALIDRDVADIGLWTAVGIGVGALIVGWLVYDLLMISPLGRNEKLFAVVAYMLIVAAAYGLTRVFSGRAAYIHVGAIFGTIMAANVWMRILPAQRKMIEAIKAGEKPNEKLAAQAKLRSKQNTFMAVPVVFLMISNHFGGTTTGGYDWIHLAILVPVGWLAAKFIRRA
ncbi:MAG TPA: urate hydroxylase PuuD [Pyrinomonadaceae bacterium]|nr:urate hydroxylase PuuD [Pyrinomonadaceae bacterium]